jgi:hypothetical protein
MTVPLNNVVLPPVGTLPRPEFGGATLRRSKAKCLTLEKPNAYVLPRVIGLAAAIRAPRGTNSYITIAVAVADDPDGCSHKLISSNEGNYQRPEVVYMAPARPDEILIDGFQHAERNIVSFVKSNGWKLTAIGATRPICQDCMAAIEECDVEPITVVRGEDESEPEPQKP